MATMTPEQVDGGIEPMIIDPDFMLETIITVFFTPWLLTLITGEWIIFPVWVIVAILVYRAMDW